MEQTINYDNKVFTYIPKGNGYYWICKETTEILSLMRPNYPIILKPSVASNGYYLVGFFTKENRINVNIHRCMAEVFLPNPNNYSQVNHIDGNKLNNSIDNLEWCSPSQNSIHAHNNGLSDSSHCAVEVHKYDLKGTYLKSYISIHEASRQEKVSPSSICNACAGKIKVSAKAQWSYEKLDSIEPYKGFDIIDYYLVDNVKITSSKELVSLLNTSRASIHRRIKKYGSSFVFEGKSIEVIYLK